VTEFLAVSFVMSVRLSVRMVQLGSHWTDFHEIWHLNSFRKPVEKIFKFHENPTRTTGIYMKTSVHLYVVQFLLEWEVLQAKVVEKLKTHTVFSITFIQKSCRVWDNVEKYCRAGQATDDNMARAHCMLNTDGYKHTLAICSRAQLKPDGTRWRTVGEVKGKHASGVGSQ